MCVLLSLLIMINEMDCGSGNRKRCKQQKLLHVTVEYEQRKCQRQEVCVTSGVYQDPGGDSGSGEFEKLRGC